MVKLIGITGSNGFIGRFLVKILEDNGFKVLAGTRQNADVTNKKMLENFIKKSDAVVHLAVYQNIFDESYDKFEKVNVEGARNVLKLCKKYGKVLILFSSEVVFGKGKDFYSLSKMAQLKEAKKYKNVIIVYPPAVLDLSKKIKWWKLMPGGVMASVGDGNNLISFIEVRDLCQYVVGILNNNNMDKLPVTTISKKEFLIKINEKIGGFKMPFRIPLWCIKLLLIIFKKTKYKKFFELIIQNEKKN